jgi:Rps23 Pro-64 3,4-dihydroxylase Tpa1-like proline 4-hydroxylase
MNNLKDYIVVMNNIIPPPVVDTILNEYKDSDDWVNAGTGGGERLDIRNCKTIGLSLDLIIQKNQETRKKIDAAIYSVSAQAVKEYMRNMPKLPDNAYVASKDTGYELLEYKTGGFYKEHLDFSENTPRSISCSFILNDDYEGGEFAFFNRELTYKLKKGSCIMFPSNFMYPHEIMPVTSGTRYSIITWFV